MQIVILDPLKEPGGQERLAIEKANYFAKKGFKVKFITNSLADLSQFPSLKHENIEIVKVKWRNALSSFAWALSMNIQFEDEVIITIANGERAMLAAIFLKLLRQLPRNRIFFIFHLSPTDVGTFILSGWKRLLYNNFLMLVRSFGTAICVAEHISVSLIEDFGWNKSRVLTIRNKRNFQKKTVRKINTDCFEIGFSGRFCPQKRLDLLLSGLTLFRKNHFGQIKVHFAGSLSESSKAEITKALEDIAVQFMFHGQLKDMDRFYGHLDIQVVCSDYEGLPLTVLEAANRGIPVVLSRINAHCEIFDLSYPLFFDSGNSHDLAECLNRAHSARNSKIIEEFLIDRDNENQNMFDEYFSVFKVETRKHG